MVHRSACQEGVTCCDFCANRCFLNEFQLLNDSSNYNQVWARYPGWWRNCTVLELWCARGALSVPWPINAIASIRLGTSSCDVGALAPALPISSFCGRQGLRPFPVTSYWSRQLIWDDASCTLWGWDKRRQELGGRLGCNSWNLHPSFWFWTFSYLQLLGISVRRLRDESCPPERARERERVTINKRFRCPPLMPAAMPRHVSSVVTWQCLCIPAAHVSFKNGRASFWWRRLDRTGWRRVDRRRSQRNQRQSIRLRRSSKNQREGRRRRTGEPWKAQDISRWCGSQTCVWHAPFHSSSEILQGLLQLLSIFASLRTVG